MHKLLLKRAENYFPALLYIQTLYQIKPLACKKKQTQYMTKYYSLLKNLIKLRP